MNAVHCLYDLVARPEYIGPIRDEIAQMVEEDGGLKEVFCHQTTDLGTFHERLPEVQSTHPNIYA